MGMVVFPKGGRMHVHQLSEQDQLSWARAVFETCITINLNRIICAEIGVVERASLRCLRHTRWIFVSNQRHLYLA
jgi:hypothetical protein